MLKKRGRRRLWAVLGTMLLAAALGVCALAASDVPKAVLNARESVVRIVTEGAMGSGFALSENSVYVVTNHHVIEGAETIEVIVDDTRWTTARVYVDLPGKDICILKTDKPLRGMPGLPLRSDAVETGLAVYALGYPGAADDFSQEFATGVDSITVTDGIVSAVRQSRAEGLQTTWAIQTNAPISPGNSGGPLVDAGVSAIFCMADRMAGGVYDYLEEHGLRAGEDISVTGFDNQDLSEYIRPALTTMSLPLSEIGHKAAEMLLERIGGEEKEAEEEAAEERTAEIKIPCSIVLRNSVKRKQP